MHFFYKLLRIVAIVVGVFLIFYSMWPQHNLSSGMVYGTTFNYEYSQYLGLDPRKVYKTILEDWGFKYIRLSAQWNLIEQKQGEYDFKELDWMMNEAEKNNARIVLTVGQKTPRWPECHNPAWATALSEEQYRTALLTFMQTVVERYKNHSALEIWQVENEPFLKFGVCRPFSEKMLHEELDLVKKLDTKHPTLVTDSGELSLWTKTARAGDLFGTTMYRVVWNRFLGYTKYDWVPASYYSLRLKLNKKDPQGAYVMELQAEPWIPNSSVMNTDLAEQYKSMNIERLKQHVNFAATTGMPRAYLWGAEWWYWLKEKKGVGDMGEYVTSLPKE